jgi:hypothetical protein
MNNHLPNLCRHEGCRRLAGHRGSHDAHPSEAWDFFNDKDKKKISKAGFATPRGGAKGAYQNHVVRSSKVIIPYERLQDVDLGLYQDGYVVRVLPDQYFDGPKSPRQEFLSHEAGVRVGENAFVLYRTHDALEQLPPMDDWQVRFLLRNGQPVARRGNDVTDVGHYVLRIPRHGDRPRRVEGPPQGVFAPEYADEDTNFLSKCVLAWLIVQTKGSPYTLMQCTHLRAILRDEELDRVDDYERNGALHRGLTSCPLCMRFLAYSELHATVSFEDEKGLTNASEQIEGATRSTVVNLFHLMPLLYRELTHIPSNIGWGHAVCNTRLGQRPCYSLKQLVEMDLKVGIIRDEGFVETFGWISDDWLMIRSPNGAVWMQLNGDVNEGVPEELKVFDRIAETPTLYEIGTDGDEVETLS